MKKIIAIILSLVMVMSLAACSTDNAAKTGVETVLHSATEQ